MGQPKEKKRKQMRGSGQKQRMRAGQPKEKKKEKTNGLVGSKNRGRGGPT